MLKQHLKSFGLKSASVKTAAALTLLFVATPMLAHSAEIKKTRYTVKFEKSILTSESGVEKVYKLFQSKAKRACRSSGTVSDMYKPLSKKECIADMVTQLVESADLAPISAYHAEKLAATN